MSSIFSREPVLTLAVVQATLGLLAAFGLNMTGEQVGAIMAFTAAILGWVARRSVSPVVPEPPPNDNVDAT